MAGMVAVNVIGVLSGLLSFYQFGAEKFASSDEGGSVVRIQVGLDSPGKLSNAGGDLPDVRLFNEAGEFLGGEYDPGYIEDGTTGKDIRVKQSSEQQATYGLFTANDDAICIALLSIVWPDEQKFGWTGDVGKLCGGSWYFSNIAIAGQDNKPACMWIDANGDQPTTAFQVHFPDFVMKEGELPRDEAFYCDGGVTFAMYETEDPNTLWYNPVKTKSKRASRVSRAMASQPLQSKRQSPPVHSADPRLVISSDVHQSPEELCASPISRGPDFLNVAHGLFCQMSTKQLYPVCSAVLVDNCFNTDTQKLVVGGVSVRDEIYSKVIDWSTGSS